MSYLGAVDFLHYSMARRNTITNGVENDYRCLVHVPFCLVWRRPSITSDFCPRKERLPLFRFPLENLEIHDENRVEHGHEQQRNERCDTQATDLRVAEWLPKGSFVQRQRKECEDRGAYSDHYWPEPDDSRINHCLFKRLRFANTATNAAQSGGVEDD